VNYSSINLVERDGHDDESDDEFSVIVETRQSFAKKYTTAAPPDEFYNRSLSHMALVKSSLEQEEFKDRLGSAKKQKDKLEDISRIT
jgi:hypothetical protein